MSETEYPYPLDYPLWVLQKVAHQPRTNPKHKTCVEFGDRSIVGADRTILCADCCLEALRKAEAEGKLDKTRDWFATEKP